MKVTLLTLSLLFSFQNTFAATDTAGQFRFTEKECHELANELSDEAFENEKKLDSMKKFERFSAETVKYLDAAKISFSKDLNQLCDKKKDAVTFDDLYKEESSCKETCKESLSVIKTPLLKIVEDLNRTKEKSEAVCLSICEKDHDKMNAMKKGLAMAMKSKASPDCTGVVVDSGRNNLKPIIIDLDKINTKTAKQVSGK
ncbi:hypothetical protein SHI21_04620 [Bacteriovorax sp. PP10]|uniref:Secreted protein n=1 Tax=Bacteriovorax antarcticus TaxID=3088717 RepID=A0ABU5VRD1_9BACT|nr:hypothetical protein [Bacteriovorax sp. PP10]MEA9355467.1 hypothetical protein [Bacteriovorax sp. PP10]